MDTTPLTVGSTFQFKKNSYKVLKSFGCGGQSQTYLVEDQSGKKRVYKKLIIPLGSNKKVHYVQTEFAILLEEKIKHPYLARAIDVSMQSDQIQNRFIGEILMEYYEGGDLGSVKRPVPEPKLKKWLYQITSAVKNLHEHGIVHRDIKPKNVFLTGSDGDAILGDFGIAKYNASRAQTMLGTPFYMAPEIVESCFDNRNYDLKVDIWSLGVLTYQLMIDEELESKYRSLCPDGVFSFSLKKHEDKRKVFYNDIKSLANTRYSQELVNLVLRLLSMEPSQRPTAKQILQAPFFHDFKLPEPTPLVKEIQQDRVTSGDNNNIGKLQQTENLRLMIKFISAKKSKIKKSDKKNIPLKSPYCLRLGVLQPDQTVKVLYETEKCRRLQGNDQYTWNEFVLENFNSQILQDSIVIFEIYKEKKQHTFNPWHNPATKSLFIGRAQCQREGLRTENNLVVYDNEHSMVGLITIINAETFIGDPFGRGSALKMPLKTHDTKASQQSPNLVSDHPLKLSPVPLEKMQHSSNPQLSSGEISPINKSKIDNNTSNYKLTFLSPPNGSEESLTEIQKIQKNSTSSSTAQNLNDKLLSHHPPHKSEGQTSRKPSFEQIPNRPSNLVCPQVPTEPNIVIQTQSTSPSPSNTKTAETSSTSSNTQTAETSSTSSNTSKSVTKESHVPTAQPLQQTSFSLPSGPLSFSIFVPSQTPPAIHINNRSYEANLRNVPNSSSLGTTTTTTTTTTTMYPFASSEQFTNPNVIPQLPQFYNPSLYSEVQQPALPLNSGQPQYPPSTYPYSYSPIQHSQSSPIIYPSYAFFSQSVQQSSSSPSISFGNSTQQVYSTPQPFDPSDGREQTFVATPVGQSPPVSTPQQSSSQHYIVSNNQITFVPMPNAENHQQRISQQFGYL